MAKLPLQIGFVKPAISNIHRIDHHTVYDVPNGLREVAMRIERGDYGPVSDVVIGVRRRDPKSGLLRYTSFAFGASDNETKRTVAQMLELALTPGIVNG